MDNDTLLRGAQNQQSATRSLQRCIITGVTRTVPLGLPYAVGKSELIHLNLTTSNHLPASPLEITQWDTIFNNKETIRLLGITIAHELNFRPQTASAVTKLQNIVTCLQRMAFSSPASMNTLSSMVTTLHSPTLTSGSEVWWTGAQHIIDIPNRTSWRFTRPITGLPSYTRSDKLLCVAGIPVLQLLLEMKSRKYAILLLLASNDYPLKALPRHATQRKGRQMGGIKEPILESVTPGTRVEMDLDPTSFLHAENISVHKGTKESTAKNHTEWQLSIHQVTIVYSDGCRNKHSCATG